MFSYPEPTLSLESQILAIRTFISSSITVLHQSWFPQPKQNQIVLQRLYLSMIKSRPPIFPLFSFDQLAFRNQASSNATSNQNERLPFRYDCPIYHLQNLYYWSE
jgi:hypothetical protein